MGLFRKWNEIQRRDGADMHDLDVCPSCSGKGFYQHGLEFAYIHECSACEGTGTVSNGIQ